MESMPAPGPTAPTLQKAFTAEEPKNFPAILRATKMNTVESPDGENGAFIWSKTAGQTPRFAEQLAIRWNSYHALKNRVAYLESRLPKGIS